MACIAPLTAALLTTLEAEASKNNGRERLARSPQSVATDDDVSTVCSRSMAVVWTKKRVLSLCFDLLQGFCAPDFQQSLKKLLAKAPNDLQVVGRMELALTVQSVVLPKYGFSGTIAGVEAMREAICPFLVDWMIKKQVDEIDKILGLPPNSTVKAARGPQGDLTSGTTAGASGDADSWPTDSWRTELSSPSLQSLPSPRLRVESMESMESTESSVSSEKSLPRADRRIQYKDFCLTKVATLELLGDLLEAFSDAAFQREIKELPKEECKDLVLKVQSQVLPKYNLPGDSFGAMLMLDAITPFIDDFLVSYLVTEMDDKIGLAKGTTASICKGSLVSSVSTKHETPQKTSLDRHQALTLCSELLKGFSEPEFQAALQTIKKNGPERALLAMSVQSEVLPRFGFPGSTVGVVQMLDAITPHAGDWMVATLVNSIDEKLGLPANTTLSSLA